MIRFVAVTLLMLPFVGSWTTNAFSQESEAYQYIYNSIDCSQWKQNPDGSWDTGPNAVLGHSFRFSNAKHITLSGNTENGVDTTAVLIKKCGKR